MKNFPHAIFTILLFVSVISAQTPTASPTPVETDEEIVKISTALIQIDVSATDKNGKIVRDLKAEDFEIFENGEKQPITNFTFVTPSSANSSATANTGNFPPLTVVKPEQIRRTIALVVDDLTLSFENIHFVKKSLRKFIDEQMRAGDLVAIVRTGGGGALQQFTQDRRRLHAAIERIKLNPFGRGGAKITLPPPDPSVNRSAGDRIPDQEAENFRQSVIATGAVNGLSYIVSGMKDLPGRKSAILFSEGFRLTNKDVTGDERDFRLQRALERLFDAASRASTVVYTIDARGLEPNPDPEFYHRQDGLNFLAEQTGGLAFKDNNDFNFGIEKSLEDQTGYYLVGYAPDAESFDATTRRFNKLQVKVKRPGLRVRYRSGFFGTADETTVAVAPNRQISAALQSPFAVADIDLRLNTLLGSDAATGAHVRSLLHVQAKDLQFSSEPDGNRKAVFDIFAVSYDETGAVADKVFRNYSLFLKGDEYARILRDGFVYSFVFPITRAGAYQFRVALRDQTSQKIGSVSQFIEVPELKNGELTLSGIILENLPLQAAQNGRAGEATGNGGSAQIDTSARRFKRGTILRYGFEIYNAKTDAAGKRQLSAQAKIFRDGKVIFEGKPFPIERSAAADAQSENSSGAVTLGTNMTAGDYALQITVTDNLAKGKSKTAVQWSQFEIVE